MKVRCGMRSVNYICGHWFRCRIFVCVFTIYVALSQQNENLSSIHLRAITAELINKFRCPLMLIELFADDLFRVRWWREREKANRKSFTGYMYGVQRSQDTCTAYTRTPMCTYQPLEVNFRIPRTKQNENGAKWLLVFLCLHGPSHLSGKEKGGKEKERDCAAFGKVMCSVIAVAAEIFALPSMPLVSSSEYCYS